MQWNCEISIQIFMPIAPNHAIFLHDKNVYLADSHSNVIELKRADDVDTLNELQWLNAYKNVYVPPNFTQEQIDKMLAWKRSDDKLPRLNRLVPTDVDNLYRPSGKSVLDPPDEGATRELIHFQSREIQKDIRIRALKIKPKPVFEDNGSMASPRRDRAWDTIVTDFADLVENKKARFQDFWAFVPNHILFNQIGPWLHQLERTEAASQV
jgi:hypothetical protein